MDSYYHMRLIEKLSIVQTPRSDHPSRLSLVPRAEVVR